MHRLEPNRAQLRQTNRQIAQTLPNRRLIIRTATRLANPLHQPLRHHRARLHIIKPVLQRGCPDINDKNLHWT